MDEEIVKTVWTGSGVGVGIAVWLGACFLGKSANHKSPIVIKAKTRIRRKVFFAIPIFELILSFNNLTKISIKNKIVIIYG